MEAPSSELGPVCRHAVGTVAKPEEFVRLPADPLAKGFRVLRPRLTTQPQQFRAAPLPVTNDVLALSAVVVVLQIPGRGTLPPDMARIVSTSF